MYGAYWIYYDYSEYSNRYPYPELDRDAIYGKCVTVPNCVTVRECGEPCINSYILADDGDPFGKFNAYEYNVDSSVSYLDFLKDFGMTQEEYEEMIAEQEKNNELTEDKNNGDKTRDFDPSDLITDLDSLGKEEEEEEDEEGEGSVGELFDDEFSSLNKNVTASESQEVEVLRITQTEEESSSIGIILGIGIPVILILLIMVIVIFYINLKLNKSTKKPQNVSSSLA